MTSEPNYHGVTALHISNLRKHADFVERQKSISMRRFALDKNGDTVGPDVVHECGSAMCAIGYVPFNKDLGEFKFEGDWDDVSLEFFGFNGGSYDGLAEIWQRTFGSRLHDSPPLIAAGMRYAADLLEAKINEGDE